ncbi:MAG: sigma 54-interacting transcriptional regulator [Candidatus Hydrogenedentes bacterium]|nr:sigma 54-interacting transcriptional regulator [Candidatus Hydrogenedentota bacterium]
MARRRILYQLVAQSGLTKGVSWTLGGKPLIIGRDPSCDVSILDSHVSRRHCQVEAVGGAVVLKDLGSRNTTLVNGEPVTACTLQPGDEIAVGNVRFVVRLTGEPEKPVAPAKKKPDSTLTIEQSTAFYVAGKRTDFLAPGRAHTIHDLADLYALSRSLWTVENTTDLTERLSKWTVERFHPASVWFAAMQDTALDIRSTYAAGDCPQSPLPRKVIERTAQTLEGTLIAPESDRAKASNSGTLLTAPLVVGRIAVGAVAIESHPDRAHYDEFDLQLLLAAACIAAPWLHSMEQIHSLKLETERLRHAKPHTVYLLGSSQIMNQTRGAIQRAAQCDLNVLILGETGSGKELAARMVHDHSARREHPLIPVNCAAIPRELFESELFGYEQGAFTGAARRKRGLLEECNGGTLFLDEVGDLSLENQARLLRVIETHAFRRLGGNEEISVDFRVVAATNRPLTNDVVKGSFRKDLYYRLNAIEIEMPPLRAHLQDVPELAQHFLELARLKAKRPIKGISPEALNALKGRPWSGNVRELRAAIERAAATAQAGIIEPSDLYEAPGLPQDEYFASLAELEKTHIVKALQRSRGQITVAAKLLGIGRTTLYEKLSRYGLDKAGTADTT